MVKVLRGRAIVVSGGAVGGVNAGAGAVGEGAELGIVAAVLGRMVVGGATYDEARLAAEWLTSGNTGTEGNESA